MVGSRNLPPEVLRSDFHWDFHWDFQWLGSRYLAPFGLACMGLAGLVGLACTGLAGLAGLVVVVPMPWNQDLKSSSRPTGTPLGRVG